jgi:hypothetical protein
MKQIINLILPLFFIYSCNDCENNKHLIDGKWRCEETKNKHGCEIVFRNGLYELTKWHDDIRSNTKGKYFFNENKERVSPTLTLVPDLIYLEKDTIILPCKNIDLLSITDSVLITREYLRRIDRFWKHNVDTFYKISTNRK